MRAAPPRFSPLIGCLAVVLVVAPAPGLVYVLQTDEVMVDRSPVIVYGTVGPPAPGPRGSDGMVTTDFTFNVEETLKGHLPAGSILVRQNGGLLPDRTALIVMGLPRLREGDRMLLFLRPEADAYQTVGLALGMFREQPGPRESRLLVRDGMASPAVGVSDDPVAAKRQRSSFPRHADEFRRWVRAYAAGEEPAADYFFAERLDQPRSVRSAYNLMKTICQDGVQVPTREESPENGLLMRQGLFDRDRPLEFVVQADGQPHVEGSLREIAEGIEAWNEDPASRIRVAMRLSERRGYDLAHWEDGLSTIVFEDPHGGWGEHTAPEGGLAAAAVRVRCDLRADTSAGAHALEILEADIVTNRGFGSWLRDKSVDPPAWFAETLTHEIGHALGIAHSCSYDPSTWTPEALASIMRPWSDPDEESARTINGDDRAAASHLYPMSGTENEWIDDCPWDEPHTLCLGEQSYRVTAEWTTGTGDDWRPALAEPVSTHAGYFHFFDVDNPEMLIKVLDGCAINGHRWVFAAGMTDVGASFHVTELATGRERLYRKTEVGKLMPTVTDTRAFRCNAGPGAAAADRTVAVEGVGGVTPSPAVAPAGAPDSVSLPHFGPPVDGLASWILNERFQMWGQWFQTRHGESRGGSFRGNTMTRDSMAFHFFTPDNIEVVVKILDGCAINGHRWVFMAGLTDVQFDFEVRDMETGQRWRVSNELGEPFSPVRDLTALSCSPPSAPLP